MVLNPSDALAWLYIDGNIIENSVDGCSYDRQMSRLVKLDVGLKYYQLCDVIYAKLNIDASLFELKIMHRCFNPVTKMFGVAPVLDDDDVELMFEMVMNVGERNSVVEIYVERVRWVLGGGVLEKRVEGVVDVEVEVEVGLDSSSEQVGLACRDFGKRGGGDLGGSRDLGKGKRRRKKKVEVCRDLEERVENVEEGGNVEGSEDVESEGSNKKMFYMQRVDNQGKRVSRKGSNGGDNGIPLHRSFDGSFMVASLKEPVFTTLRDVVNVTDLEKGMVFVSRDEMADIVSQVHNRHQQEIKVIRADATHWTADCKQKGSGCKWRLTASKRRRHGFFEIMNISGSHKCVNLSVTQEDANLQTTITPDDANLQPTITPEDVNIHLTISPEDANLQLVTQEDANLICSNMEEVPKTPPVDQSV